MSSHISGIKSHFCKSKKVEFRGGGGGSGTRHPPPPPQTLTRKFSKSKKLSWSLGVVVGGGGSGARHPPPTPQTLTRKFSKSKKSSWSLGVVVGGGSEHHFNHFWHILHLRGWHVCLLISCDDIIKLGFRGGGGGGSRTRHPPHHHKSYQKFFFKSKMSNLSL